MDLRVLNETALKMVQPGKGILAADESVRTIQKRFDPIGVENTEANRRDYRDLMFRASDAMAHMSSVILYRETLTQQAADGTPMVELVRRTGAIPGIKVDEGTQPLPGFPGETITEGLDGLPARLAKDRDWGARFAKWRAVLHIADGRPTWGGISANAHALARYAAICQDLDVVPIVEAEVLMDGDHDIDACERATRWTLQVVFDALFEQRVALEGMILKPNMVVPGLSCPRQASVEEVAERTIKVLKETVPAAVPGITFLSGGQEDEPATAHLDAMNKMRPLPWAMTYSYGRALQHAAQEAWRGRPENVRAAQRAFAHRAKMNSLASLGQWDPALERQT